MSFSISQKDLPSNILAFRNCSLTSSSPYHQMSNMVSYISFDGVEYLILMLDIIKTMTTLS